MVHQAIKSESKNWQEGISYLEDLMDKQVGGEPPVEKMGRFLDLLGTRKIKPKLVQIVGTNGKGSVTALTTSILNSAGFSVGSSISPHLSSMNERCRIDGDPIDDITLGTYALAVKSLCEKAKLELQFPLAVLAASLMIFQDRGLDYVVLESGLGGRLDAATALKDPEVVALTTIGRDHEHSLGSFPFEITAEKIAAVRDDAKVVLGRLDEKVLDFISQGLRIRGIDFCSLGHDFNYIHSNDLRYLSGENLSFCMSNNIRVEAPLVLEGSHQADNLAVSLEIVSKLGVDLKQLDLSSLDVRWRGRLERVEHGSREWIFDCAHNEDGLAAVVSHLAALSDKKYIVCFAGLGEKNWSNIMRRLQLIAEEFVFVHLENPRAVDVEVLSENLSGTEISSSIHQGSYRELIEGISTRDNNLPVLVIGSLYLVGGVREELIKI